MWGKAFAVLEVVAGELRERWPEAGLRCHMGAPTTAADTAGDHAPRHLPLNDSTISNQDPRVGFARTRVGLLTRGDPGERSGGTGTRRRIRVGIDCRDLTEFDPDTHLVVGQAGAVRAQESAALPRQ